MRVLIVEDEKMAANRLTQLLAKLAPEAQVLDQVDSVKRAIEWLNTQDADLLFFDIQLADGLSFEILEKVKVETPIIFTTAYDEYAIKAFKVNSIDYLLKPIDPEELKTALEKFQSQFQSPAQPVLDLRAIEQAMKQMTKKYKERFLVKIGDHIKALEVSDASFFFSQEKATYLQNSSQKRFIIDYSLEQVQELLDPEDFYRINRKYLISMKAIKDIVAYSNSRLRLILDGSDEMDAIVSRDKVQDFKKWLDR
jgi:DNA-binding LytR/AlgR family response regulator